ncbi:MAG: hypothetical protein ACP5HH_04420 [Fervidicoccaceae archaeon]
MDTEEKVAVILIIGGIALLVLLGFTVLASQVDCPSYMPLYSQPGLKLVYNITYVQGNYTEREIRVESVVSRDLGSYQASILILNVTDGASQMVTLYNSTHNYSIKEGYGMEGIGLIDNMLPVGIREYEVSGITFLGTRYYDPNSGAIVTVDSNTGIILSIEYTGLGSYYNASLIEIEGGTYCHAW